MGMPDSKCPACPDESRTGPNNTSPMWTQWLVNKELTNQHPMYTEMDEYHDLADLKANKNSCWRMRLRTPQPPGAPCWQQIPATAPTIVPSLQTMLTRSILGNSTNPNYQAQSPGNTRGTMPPESMEVSHDEFLQETGSSMDLPTYIRACRHDKSAHYHHIQTTQGRQVLKSPSAEPSPRP